MAVRARRLVSGAMAVVLALTLVVLADADPASAGLVVTERVSYGRNEAVIVDIGQTDFTTGCAQGADDFIYSVADLYVIRGTDAPSGALSDVSGAPNTVFGSTGGGFFGDVLGYTKPGGSIGPGTYSVVIDECQDGQFDAAVDSFLPDVFRVSSEVVGPQIPDIGSLKTAADEKAARYEFYAEAWDALLKLNDAVTWAGAMTGLGGVLPIAYMVATKIAVSLGLPDPGAILTMTFGNMGRQWRGIAADPPDADFAQATVLGDVIVPAPLDPADPLDAAGGEAAATLATSTALSQALLESLERYQGANQAGDGEWMLHHARAAAHYAQLLQADAPAEAAVLDGVAAAIDASPTAWETEGAALVAEIDAYLASGPSAAERASLANHGSSPAAAAHTLADLRTSVAAIDTTTLPGELRAQADEVVADAPLLGDLAADLGPVIATLEADPFVEGAVPVVDPGGPYAGAVGAPLALDSSATTGPGDLTFAWDLDGDGAFDDAVGATPSPTPAAARTGLVGVQVTSTNGYWAVGYAPITVTGPAGPTLATPTPSPRAVAVPADGSQAFSVAPGGTAPVTTWWLDGVEVGAGAGFTYSPLVTDAGSHVLEAQVADGGVVRSVDWFVEVTAPDGDTDGYWSTVDCDDTEATTYPGAPELLDGVDNDCDPSTVDGGAAPVTEAGTDLVGPEGAAVALSGAGFTHATSPVTATVDWGDGSVEAAGVSGSTITGTHTYADDGTFAIEVCATAPEGKVACDVATATIANEAALPVFGDLSDWTQEEVYGAAASGGLGIWTVAPDGKSVLQTRNGQPTFFVADGPLGASEAGIDITVETTGDDDFVGFALGVEPGTIDTADGDLLLVDWKQNDQSGYGCTKGSLAGLALSRVVGEVDGGELWAHEDCPTEPGSVTELARAATLGSTGWADNETYSFRFRASAERVQIWVDETLEFDLTAPDGDPFPVGNFAFYNYSQSSVRYSGYLLSPGSAVEGSPETIVADFEDAGTADTHTGLWTWGDGSPTDLAVVTEVGGAGTAAGTHTWVDDGDFPTELCLTDDDGATACQGIDVDVANAAPEVAAGADRTVGADAVLVDSTFEDLGVLDTHTATVDWGDGGGPEPAAVNETLGEGIVTAAHTYLADGTYPVEVCVTDDDGDTGCDTLELVANVTNLAPVPEGDGDSEAVEGDVVTKMVAFTDANPGDRHTVTVDWGDGTATEPVAFQSNGSIGTGGGAHLYPDDGSFTVTFEVCDGGPLCDQVSSTVTVVNASPVVDGEVTFTAVGDVQTHSLAATFTDLGLLDTHTATVDWGDGAGVEAATVTQGSGSGTVAASHVYGAPGAYTVEVCVDDGEGGLGCDEILTDAGVPGPPLDVSAIGGDTTAGVRWEVPAHDGGSAILEYEVEPSADGANVLVPADQLTAVVTGLSNDVDYTFRVRARNANGWGPWSVPSNLARTRPSCPGAPFTDVGPDNPFCPEIKWMGDTGVSVGYPDGSYLPLAPVSRGVMAAFTFRLLNPEAEGPEPCDVAPFPDVSVDNPFCGVITWLL